MPKRTKEERTLRSRPVIKKLLKHLEEEDTLHIDDDVMNEITSFLEVRPLLPSILNHQSRKNIRKAQTALTTIELRIDMCLRAQAGVRTRLRLFTQLEYDVKRFLYRYKFISEKASRPTVEQAVALIVPELPMLKEEWKEFEELCRSVHKRLLDAKDTMKLLSRLDDNYRWANADP